MTQKSSDSKTTEALARARGIALSSDGHLTRDMFGEEFVDFMREVSQAEDSDFEFRSDEAREADRAALLENHPEVVVDVPGPPLYLLRSTSPSVSVRELCARYAIETYREYVQRARKGLNIMRMHGEKAI